jgi:4-hydroxybenzoate polyprenyltransferase
VVPGRRIIEVSRPRFWFYLAGPVIVGGIFGAASTAELFSPIALVYLAYFLLPANIFLYGINDLYDAQIDQENPKKTAYESRWEGRRTTVAAVVLSAGGGLALTAVSAPVTWPAMGGFLLLAWQYSAPPGRFKTTPVADSVSNGLYILPGVAVYAQLSGALPPAAAIVGAWLWSMAMHTYSAIPDIGPDRTAGITTTATWLGSRRTLWYCGVVWSLAAATFAIVDPRWGALMLVYPLLLVVWDRRDIPTARAYWYYPWINTAVGAVIANAGLWGLLYG